MKRASMLGAVLLALFVAGIVEAAQAAPRGRAKATVVFKLRADVDDVAFGRLEAVLDAYGFKTDRYSEGLGHFRMKSKAAGLPAEEVMAAFIEASGAVEFAEPDYIAAPVLTPNDPSLGSQWHHTKINSRGAWDAGSGASIVAAVCDTGVDPDHPDLQGNLLADLGWNTYLNTNAWDDIHGHGTSVAGCIAAIGNNGLGVAGVAYSAKIIPIRICYDSTGYAYYSDMAEGIRYGVDHGAKVVNLSYGGWYGSQIRDACQYAWGQGAIVCVAAGNDGLDQAAYAESDYMLLVGATDSADAKASWSNYGVPVDFFAPGVSIYTTRNGGVYGSVSGTSFASPISAGLATLVYGINPSFSPAEVESIIMSTCVDLGAVGDDSVYGAGRIDAAAAAGLARGIISNAAPVAVVTVAPNPAAIGAAVTFDGTASYDVDGTIQSHAWTFGDGATASGSLVTHAYSAVGTYTVTLTVSDEYGKTGVKTASLAVIDPNAVAAPTALSASVASRNVTLRWTDNASNETGYYVERGTYDSRKKLYTWARVATLAANATSYAQTVAKGTWYYRVQAFNASTGRTSAYSSQVKVTVK